MCTWAAKANSLCVALNDGIQIVIETLAHCHGRGQWARARSRSVAMQPYLRFATCCHAFAGCRAVHVWVSPEVRHPVALQPAAACLAWAAGAPTYACYLGKNTWDDEEMKSNASVEAVQGCLRVHGVLRQS